MPGAGGWNAVPPAAPSIELERPLNGGVEVDVRDPPEPPSQDETANARSAAVAKNLSLPTWTIYIQPMAGRDGTCRAAVTSMIGNP